MKKVICVEQSSFWKLTQGKEYDVLSVDERTYLIKDDGGEKLWMEKSCFRDATPVLYYGQEVTGEWKGQEKSGHYIATVTLINGETRYLIQPPCQELLDVCTSIRPIRTVKEQVVELLNGNKKLADKILNIVNKK